MLNIRMKSASEILYDWACAQIGTQEAKRRCAHLGYDIDFRQPDFGAYMEAKDCFTGEYVEIPV